MIAYENWFGPKRFVLMAVSGLSLTFWAYQDRAGEHGFTRMCQAEMLGKGQSRAKATRSCNCIEHNMKHWYKKNPEGEIPATKLNTIAYECSTTREERQVKVDRMEEARRKLRNETSDWGEGSMGDGAGDWGW